MGSIGQVGPLNLSMSAAAGDAQLALALDQMGLGFGNLMSQITLMFNVMLRFMKDGNVAQFRAAKAA